MTDGPKKRGLLSACGGNRDDIGSGVSTDDNLSLQICHEPRPGAVFFEGGNIAFFERRSVPPQQRGPTVQRR